MNKATLALAMGLSVSAALPMPAQANPAGDRVRLVFALTPSAKAVIGSDSAVRDWIAAQTATASQTSTTFSGGQTSYQVSTNANGTIQFANVPSGSTQNGNAVGRAAGSIPINELRDAMNADVVVIVTAESGDSDLSSLMDCTKTGAAAARKAFVGVNIYGQSGGTGTLVEQRIMAALGKAQCAGEDDAYAFIEGTSSDNCTLYRTLLSQATSVTRDNWIVNEGGIAATGTSDVGPDDANAKMATACTGATYGVFVYACSATGTCTAPGGNQYCTHNRTQTDTRGLPTCTPGSNNPNTSPPGCIGAPQNMQSPWSKSSLTCTGSGSNSYTVNLGLLSNPAKWYHGIAMGTPYKNAVGKMNARFTEAKAYYQTKIAPGLKEAAGITGK